jgi:hypothetical protein
MIGSLMPALLLLPSMLSAVLLLLQLLPLESHSRPADTAAAFAAVAVVIHAITCTNPALLIKFDRLYCSTALTASSIMMLVS